LDIITDIAELEALYGAPNPRALTKVATSITPLYRRWIEASRFVILSTVGPDGTDATPRGDDGPVIRIASETALWLPDWPGNNRLDSLRNILRDPRASLMFMVHGSTNVVRVNGRACITADEAVCKSFERKGKHPRSVIVIEAEELYFQCAKAILRARLWDADTGADVPSAGDFLSEAESGFDGGSYDATYADHARDKMW